METVIHNQKQTAKCSCSAEILSSTDWNHNRTGTQETNDAENTIIILTMNWQYHTYMGLRVW